MAQPQLLLYSRQGCCLCEGLEERLRALPGVTGLEVMDVDRDPALQQRYGLTELGPEDAVLEAIGVKRGAKIRGGAVQMHKAAEALLIDPVVNSTDRDLAVLQQLGLTLALALDTLVFTSALRSGTALAVAAGGGFLCGLALNYALSTRLVFSQHRLADRRLEFVGFALIGVAGLILTEITLWVTMVQLGLMPLPAKLISAGVTFLSNFFLRKWLLFTPRRAAQQAKP